MPGLFRRARVPRRSLFPSPRNARASFVLQETIPLNVKVNTAANAAILRTGRLVWWAKVPSQCDIRVAFIGKMA